MAQFVERQIKMERGSWLSLNMVSADWRDSTHELARKVAAPGSVPWLVVRKFLSESMNVTDLSQDIIITNCTADNEKI